eukprot:TRINITY_DN62590_c0_g1_i1.p1 TRINITY_DN62590_c0_g1~~TRINITY_DN62590_c0_g1_i1.p1  ORF type:complete len:361 (-),score=36.31 TRINITY_DN62590_c0_g1_i1:479-1561(-)
MAQAEACPWSVPWFSNAYESLWRPIIRPARAEYKQADLGPSLFRVDGRPFQRCDLQLQNARGQTLYCSHFVPYVTAGRPEQGDAHVATARLPNRGVQGSTSATPRSPSPFMPPSKKLPEAPTPRAAPCVVYVHGSCSCRLEALELVPLLLRKGVTVFCFDLSGSGWSDGEYISLGYHEQQDICTALMYLRSSWAVSRIGLWGRSMGAAASILRAAGDVHVAACVLDSPFTSLNEAANETVAARQGGMPVPQFLLNFAMDVVRTEVRDRAGFDIDLLRPIDEAPKARCPAFFGTATDDDVVPPHHVRRLYAKWGGAHKRLNEFEGGHNGTRPEWFIQSAIDFLAEHLACEIQRVPSITMIG